MFKKGILLGAFFLGATVNQASIRALSMSEAMENVADRLAVNQIKTGINAGSWPNEAVFTGSIVPGMVSAYQQISEPNCRSSAELGGEYIIWAAGGNFYGDEAFCLIRLSDVADDPCDNPWRTAVSDFYYNVKHTGGTEAYISQFSSAESSTAVFYLANYVVAAYYVNAEDKEIWQEGLVSYLAQVDDDSSVFPVMALGIATWALAQTGPLDDTFIDPSGGGAPYWNLIKLSDLPELLLSHQVPDGEPIAGSFYWRFDHGDGGFGGPVSGYTEDTIFGTLGLIAVSELDSSPDLNAAIVAARGALLSGISCEGKVWERLTQEGSIYYAYAGEMLQALGELIFPGDLDIGGTVDFTDFAIFGNNWQKSNCAGCSWCEGADLDHSGEVDFADMRIFAMHWLKGASI